MNWSSIFTLQHLSDVVDIIIIWAIIYYLLKLIRGTKAINILNGILVFILVKIIASLFHLETLNWIMNSIIQWAVLGVIIIFQPEIRQGLDYLGQSLSLNKKTTSKDPTEQAIEEIISACKYMSKRRIGALICIENEQDLTSIAKTGIKLDAEISSQLLINIFIPNTPLHDGAVIIQSLRITSAASFLPLSENPNIPKELGTRHRAAVGLSEQTDAVTLVVSEETGDISITYKGELYRRLEEDEIRDFLLSHFVNDDRSSQNSFLSSLLDKNDDEEGDTNE